MTASCLDYIISSNWSSFLFFQLALPILSPLPQMPHSLLCVVPSVSISKGKSDDAIFNYLKTARGSPLHLTRSPNSLLWRRSTYMIWPQVTSLTSFPTIFFLIQFAAFIPSAFLSFFWTHHWLVLPSVWEVFSLHLHKAWLWSFRS